MFTHIDKNLLIAAMESAIYHACVNANVVSLHAIETGVSSLRQRFDQDADSVSDADIFNLVDTIERAKIPTISQISALNNDTNIADRVVSFLWKNILEKPATFPSEWSLVQNKPSLANANHTHAAYALTTHGHADLAEAEHTHAAYALTTHGHADLAEAEHTHADYALTTHTHPEYAGGGAASASAASAWVLWCPRRWGLTYTLPPDIWSGARLRVLVSGTIRETEEGCTILYLYDEGSVAASLVTDADNQVTGYLAPVFIHVANAGRSMTAILDITPTAMTVTINGVTSSGAITRTATAQTALHIDFPGWETISRVGVWTGDPATTAPMILADAAHIDNNILINQAARHIGEGQYDLTLDAPVVIFQ